MLRNFGENGTRTMKVRDMPVWILIFLLASEKVVRTKHVKKLTNYRSVVYEDTTANQNYLMDSLLCHTQSR